MTSIIITLIIVSIVAFNLYKIVKNKNNSSCGCNCSGCSCNKKDINKKEA